MNEQTAASLAHAARVSSRPPSRKSKTLLNFGASTAQGVGDEAGGGYFARASRDERLKAVYVKFVNRGVGGNCVTDMLARADDAVAGAGRPFDVIVMLGCNDVPRQRDARPGVRSTPADYRATLESLLARVKGDGRSLLVSSFAVSSERTGVSPDVFATYVDAAIALARSAGYDVWDLWRETLPRAAEYWAADGLHFNDAGHQYIADGVVARLG